MKNELTNVECLLILAACLAGVIAVMGCVATEPTRVHTVERFKLLVCPQDNIMRLSRIPQCRGFAQTDERIIFVRWDASGRTDKHGERLPDFETLGHEVWHLVKGAWHGAAQERLVITTRGNVSLFDPCVTNKLEIKGTWHGGRQ